jgi:tetratricopeptide (TPR) repeat protein
MDNSNVLLERSRLLLQQGRYEDAIREIKNLLQQEPAHHEALSIYAQALFGLGQLDEAIALLHRAISADPTNSFYFYLLAFGCYRKNNNEEALAHLATATELHPYFAEYYGLTAFVYLEQLKFEPALTKADEGLAIDPENITCLNARSTALNKLRRIDDAIDTMQDTLAKDPDNAFTHTTIGWNLLEKGSHKQAMGHFREALRIDPNLRSAKLGLKEALKSKIPPYRWLLQFSFWVNNKGRNFRWAFAIILFVAVRLIVTASSASENFSALGIVVAGAYFVFAATSWVIGPLANVFLLLHKDGKYALESREKTNALAFLACIMTGIAIFSIGAFAGSGGEDNPFPGAGLVALVCCIPAGHMRFPVRLRNNSFSQWLSIALLLLGLACLILAFLQPVAFQTALIFFVLGFIIYTWTSQRD